jgi:hypothetical protein
MEEFNCKMVRANLWDYAARTLARSVGDSARTLGSSEMNSLDALRTDAHRTEAQPIDACLIDAHLDSCRDCDRRLADVSSVRKGFRHLPVQAVPPLVETRLQVIASRERSRQLLRLNPAAWLRDKLSGAMMAFDHFLRPYAVPATGGLMASCLCFSLIAHTLEFRPYLAGDGDDMPIGLYTEVTFDASPFSFPGKDVTVELTVDANGAVTDFTPIAQPGGSNPTPEELNQIASLVLYSTFTPATRFGQRVSSKRLFALHHLDFAGSTGGTSTRD